MDKLGDLHGLMRDLHGQIRKICMDKLIYLHGQIREICMDILRDLHGQITEHGQIERFAWTNGRFTWTKYWRSDDWRNRRCLCGVMVGEEFTAYRAQNTINLHLSHKYIGVH
jgi:hypothetical protein